MGARLITAKILKFWEDIMGLPKRPWFDMCDLARVADHIHDGIDIEVLEGPGPPHSKPARRDQCAAPESPAR
jgi:hypothetical protein